MKTPGTTTVLKDSAVWDDTISGAGVRNPDGNSADFLLREYWRTDTTYDWRGFMAFTLGAVPTEATVEVVKLGIFYYDGWGQTTINSLHVGATSNPFTPGFTWTTSDGSAPWSDGNGAGVDPFSPGLPNLLSSVTVNPLAGSVYKMVATAALRDYIQAQVAAGEDAYLWFAVSDTDADDFHRFAAVENGSGTSPYLSIDWTNDPAETDSPSPNPMTWLQFPYADSHTWVQMQAVTASDPSGVEYYFDEISGNPGGSDSGWQGSPIYIDSGLQPNTPYRYRVRARDQSAQQNTTAYSPIRNVRTQHASTYQSAVPSPFLMMAGYSDTPGFKQHFGKFLPHFTAVGGTTSDAAFVNALRAQGKLFVHHVSNPYSTLPKDQLVAQWRIPFDNTLGDQLPGGFDAIEIDELHHHPDGTSDAQTVADALQELRTLYPHKIICAWTRWQLATGGNGTTYVQTLNAVRDYTNVNMLEVYIREGNVQNYLFNQYAQNLNTQSPGLFAKTVFGLYTSQGGFVADDTATVGYWGLLDSQFHTIRNNLSYTPMSGLAFWVYYRSESLTSEYCAKLIDHYYTQGHTSHFGDGNMNPLITNPQFDSNTGWTRDAGSGGTLVRTPYITAGVPAQHDDHGLATHGSWCLKMTRGSTPNRAIYSTELSPGMTYTLSAYVHAGSGGSVNPAKVKVETTSGDFIASREGRDVQPVVGAGSWRRIFFHFDLYPGQNGVRVVLTDEHAPAGNVLYWDFIELEEAYPTPALRIKQMKRNGTGVALDWHGNYSNRYIIRHTGTPGSAITQWSVADHPGENGYTGSDSTISHIEPLHSVGTQVYGIEVQRSTP